MKIIKNIRDIEGTEKLGVTIGNFDGVHLGHQQMIREIKSQCDQLGLNLVALTFVPHPSAILCPKNLKLINTYKERRELMRPLGVNYLQEIDFTRDLSLFSPPSFIEDFLLCHPGVQAIFLGYDFAFGANKEGDYELVKEYVKERNVKVFNLAELKASGEKVSSSHVRESLAHGDVFSAMKLLGRPFFLEGKVIRGEGRGVQIGFPTANLEHLTGRVDILPGVYITRTKVRGQLYGSVTNVGVNPTFNTDQNQIRIETFILDFDSDIYGEDIQINFYERIRKEKKFKSVQELKLQIALDVKTAYEFFKA